MMEKNLNSTQPMQGWRERFDEKFCVKSNPPRWIFGTHLKKDLNDKDIIDFISQQKSLSYFQGRADMVRDARDLIENYNRFNCGVCDSNVSNLSHTQFCQFRNDLLLALQEKEITH